MENSSPTRTGPQPKLAAACVSSPVVARAAADAGAGAAGAGAAGARAGAGAIAVAAAGTGLWPLLEAVGSAVAAAEDAMGAVAGAALEGDDVRPAEVGVDAAFVVAATPHPVRDKAPPMAVMIAIFLNKIPLRA